MPNSAPGRIRAKIPLNSALDSAISRHVDCRAAYFGFAIVD